MVEFEDLDDPAHRQILRDARSEVHDLPVIEEFTQTLDIRSVDRKMVECKTFRIVKRCSLPGIEHIVFTPRRNLIEELLCDTRLRTRRRSISHSPRAVVYLRKSETNVFMEAWFEVAVRNSGVEQPDRISDLRTVSKHTSGFGTHDSNDTTTLFLVDQIQARHALSQMW
jgi:hypothetical protein